MTVARWPSTSCARTGHPRTSRTSSAARRFSRMSAGVTVGTRGRTRTGAEVAEEGAGEAVGVGDPGEGEEEGGGGNILGP
jgi:hypothetical protein